MKCRLNRFYKKTYCARDFKYSVTLYKESPFEEREFDQYDTSSLYVKKYDIKCGFEKFNSDLKINGEVINPSSQIKLIAFVYSKNEINAIINNMRSYFIKYNKDEYDIMECDYMNGDEMSRYFYMHCEKRANVIKE